MPPPAPRPPPTALQPHLLAPALTCSILLLLHVLLLLSFFPAPSRAEPTSDRTSLLAFLSATPHDPRRIDWLTNTTTTTACLWRGITCDPTATAVIALRLPGTGLSGPIPPSTPLANLTSLRYLSLRSNALSGPLPEALLAAGARLPRLRGLYLQANRFSGEIPPGVGTMKGMLRLDLSRNNLTGGIPPEVGGLKALKGLFLQGNSLTGEIPVELAGLTALTGLLLQGNRFTGGIPQAMGNLMALVEFNVSGNRLTGPIPKRLGDRFPASAFAGNLGLCGNPLPPCGPAATPGPAAEPTGSNKRRKLSKAAIIAIAAVGGALFLLLALILILILCCRLPRRLQHRPGSPKTTAAGAAPSTVSAGGGDTATTSSASKDDIRGGGGGAAGRLSSDKKNKLTFLDTADSWYSFDLEDLLRASAEVLGKGALGTSYKAVLEEGATVVVKRLRGENATAGKPEFEACMQAVARAAAGGGHRNVQPLKAYYYSKDERLLLFDYVRGGSLSATLHANRGTGRTPLEWPSRLRIALTAARGLLHLHAAADLIHGNLKASNVLLRRDSDGAAAAVLSDYALHPLFGPNAPHTRAAGNRASGYRAPERMAAPPTHEADVYAYGVLVLELLTGRSPGSPGAEESVGGAPGDLPRWVRSVVREEWTAEVLDADLVRYGSEEEMVRLLQVALACTETMPTARPRLEEVVRMVEEVADAAAAAEGEDSGTGKAAAGILSSSEDPASEAPTPPAIRTP